MLVHSDNMKAYITNNTLGDKLAQDRARLDHLVLGDGTAHDLGQEVKDADLLRQFVPMTVRDPQLLRHHYAPPPKGPTTR